MGPRFTFLRAREAFRACAGLVVVAVAVLLVPSAGSGAATSSTVVGATVPSSIAITDQCLTDASHKFGLLTPGSSAITDTGANVCRYGFQSSNDTAMLRAYQRDRVGTSMTQQGGSFVAQQGQPNLDYEDVDAFDSSRAIAVGPGASIATTINGGALWTEQTCAGCPWNTNAGTIARNNSAVMWVVGDGGAIYKSTNTGGTWASQTSGTTEDLEDVTAVTDQLVFAVGGNGTILRTQNGGTSWAPVTACANATGRRLTSVSAPTANDVWVVGDQATCRSSNGNAVTPTFNDMGSFYYGTMEVSAIDGSTAWLTGDRYRGVYRTVDGGANWTYYSTGSIDYNYAIDAISATSAIVAGLRGEVLKTTDTGATWTHQPSGTGETLKGVAAVSATHAFVVGYNQTIAAQSDGSSWTLQKSHASSATLIDVDAFSEQVAWAVGSKGTIQATTDGGATWPAQTSGTTNALHHVAVVDAGTVWAVGEAGTILRTTNGGTTWSSQTSGTTQLLRTIATADSNTAWAAGNGGTIVHTTNGGATWSSQPSGTTDTIGGIAATSPSDVVFTTDTGLIRRSTDGGSTWTTVYSGGEIFGAVDFASPLIGYANAANNRRAITTDGGATWTTYGGGANEHFDVEAVSTDVAFFADIAGGIAQTTDRGQTVQWFAGSPYQGTVLGIAAPDASTAWIVGERGEIVKRLPPVSISDYGGGNNWSSGAATNMFGVCLQAVSGTTTPVTWTKDTFNTSGTCEMLDTDPWNPIPTTPTKIATTSSAGAAGQVDLVWGVHMSSTQPVGDYSATVVFEAIAPDA